MFSLRRGLVSLCVLVALLPPVASKHTVDSNAFSAQDAKSAQDVIDSAGIQNAFEDVHEALHDMVYSKLLDAEHPKVSSTLLISPTNRALGRFVDLTTAVFGLDARHVLTLDVSDPRLATEKINKNLFKFIDRYQQEQHLIVVKGLAGVDSSSMGAIHQLFIAMSQDDGASKVIMGNGMIASTANSNILFLFESPALSGLSSAAAKEHAKNDLKQRLDNQPKFTGAAFVGRLKTLISVPQDFDYSSTAVGFFGASYRAGGFSVSPLLVTIAAGVLMVVIGGCLFRKSPSSDASTPQEDDLDLPPPSRRASLEPIRREDSAVKTTPVKSRESSWQQVTTPKSAPAVSRSSLNSSTKKQLSERCRKLGLRTTGRKAELVERLFKAQTEQGH